MSSEQAAPAADSADASSASRPGWVAFLRSRSEQLSTLPLVVFVLVASPILFTPYRDDDLINRTLPDAIASGQETLWSHFWILTRQWMENEGRFFPGSVGWGTFVFATFADRLSYKSLLLLLSVGACVVAAAFTRWLLGRWAAAPVVLVLAGLWALRFAPFDGLDSFAGLLPLTVGLTLGGTLLLSRGRLWAQVLGGLAWAAAITTYEMAILMAPALIAALLYRRARRGAAIMAALAAADVIVVVLLRAGVTPAPGYTLELDPGALVRTFVRQAGAALPLAQWWYPGAPDLDFPLRAGLIWAAVFGLVGLAVGLSRRVGPPARPGAIALLALTGASAWLLPSALTGATLRWQQELQPGNGYLSVVWGYVGVGLLMVAAVEAAATWLGPRRARPLAVASAVGFGVLAALTLVSNLAVAGSLAAPPG